MNCPLLSEETSMVLFDYSAGRLPAEDRPALERHIGLCSDCAAFQSGQSALWNTLDAWEPAPVSMSFNRNLWKRIDAIAAEPWYARLHEGFRFGAWKPAFPLAAAMFVVAAGFMLDHRGLNSAGTGTAAGSGVNSAANGASNGASNSVATSEADQIERTLDDIQLLHQFNSVPASDATPRAM